MILNALKVLEDLTITKSANKDEFFKELNNIKTICDKSLAQRVAVGNTNAYNVIINVMIAYESDLDVTKACLKTMISLMTGQPDLIDPVGIQLMLNYFDKEKNDEIIQLVLKWVKECCVKHEQNRYENKINQK